MGAHLVTGYGGKEHITSADQGMYNAGTLGIGKYVLPVGNMFEASIITNNLVKIKDGCLVNQGRNINIAVNDYEECEIDNGIQALKRNDLIVIRYEKNSDTGIETAKTIVIKGVSGEEAVDPDYIEGNILNGDNIDDFPLYRVKLDGLNITELEPLFNTMVSLKKLIENVDLVNKSVNELNTNLGTYDYFEGTVSSSSFSKISGKVELELYKNLLLILNNSNGCCIATTSIPVPILKSYYNSTAKIVRAACPGSSDYYIADIYYDESSKSIYGKVSIGCNLQIYLQK